ncbi:hypothetical protein AAEY27_07265 [Kosakonia sp. BYX6]|uniref:Uncharacterized protein n=1 Tax=Kosakonia calanthes TaxID=3139408 RepID=A0ABZ3B8V9_9ENTR
MTGREKVLHDASTVQIEKRIAARGAQFTRYRFVSESGVTYPWQSL